MLLDNKLFTPTKSAQDVVTVEGQIGTNTLTYTMPNDVKARLSWIHCEYTSSASVGNRQIRMAMLNSAGTVIFDTHAGAVQAASLARHYLFMQGIYRETAFIDGEIQVSLPKNIVIPAGYKIKVYDSSAINSGDSMLVNFQYDAIL